jgi:hypothetical protein
MVSSLVGNVMLLLLLLLPVASAALSAGLLPGL